MKNPPTIQRVLALVFLLLFTFSMAPKKYLHDLVADHTDFYGYSNGDNETTVSKAGFNCDCEELVVTAPFVPASFSADFALPTQHNSFVISFHRQFNLITQYTKDLRGPPSVA